MYKWYLPTVSEVLAPEEPVREQISFAARRLQAEREWYGAIAALNVLLQQTLKTCTGNQGCKPLFCGVVLSGPLPVLETPELVSRFSTWTFTPNLMGLSAWMPLQLLPAQAQQALTNATGSGGLSLMPNDPLAAEQFCVVLTPEFSLAIALGENAKGDPCLLFSFDPAAIAQVWQSLRGRLIFTNPEHLKELDHLLEKFAPITPSYQLVTQFSRLMLAHLPQPAEWEVREETQASGKTGNGKETQGREVVLNAPTKLTREDLRPISFVAQDSPIFVEGKVSKELPPSAQKTLGQQELVEPPEATESFDSELLQAIAHEVRTPLTTIRTLTRLLLKRKDLSPDVLKRLQAIDRECTEQIDRFNLFFRAVEVEKATSKQPLTPLASISLAQLFQQAVPRWQEQAVQRNLTLNVRLPQKMPMVVTDPTMLDQVLTGLIDRITHTLAPGSHIEVRVTLAGHQLKLQFESRSQPDPTRPSDPDPTTFISPLKSLGQLLMFQPETGNLSLNLAVTKNLFQALGGKMTVKQKPQQGEVLTIFLPLETRRLEE